MTELQDKIKSWLDEHGYPLEMRVACAFRRAGFRVIQSDYYRDPTTQTHRELDVVASLDLLVGELIVRIEFIIECKSSKSKPWLMFCSPDLRLAPPARVAQRTASEIASSALHSLAQIDDIQELELFQVTEPAAYGATQAFTAGSDIVYTALSGVGAAVVARAKETNSALRMGQRLCTILFPVVVIEGRLFSCILQDDSAIAISETERGTLLWRNPVGGEPHTIVSILTDRVLQDYAERSIRSIHEFFRLAHAEFDRVFTTPRIVATSRL